MTEPLHPAIQSALNILSEKGSDAVFGALDPGEAELLDRATEVFESFPAHYQITVVAIMFGMLLATIDGEPTQAEMESKVLITKRDRLALFLGQANAVYAGAMEMRKLPDCPGPNKRSVM